MCRQDRGLAAAENQDDGRLGRGQIRAAVRNHQSPAPFHPGQVPVACRGPGQQAGKGARLRRCGARPCLVKEVACRGDLCSPTVSRSGPRSPLFNVWAVRLLSLSGVTPGYWPGSASGPASCFASQISSCLRGVQEAAQGRRSRVRGPKVGCRRRRYAKSPGRRAIGCVAFQPAAGTIRSVASCPRGGDGVPRRAARSDGTPPMTARLAGVIRRWVRWAPRWRGRRGRDPDDVRDSGRIPGGAGSQCPGGARRCRMAGGAPGRPAIPASAQNPCRASRASDCAFPQRPGRQHRPRAPSRPPPSAACPGPWPSYSVMSHRATIRSSACCGSRRLTRTGGASARRRLPAPAGARPGHPAGTARSQPYGQRRAHRVLDVCILEHRLGAGLVVGDEHHSALFAPGHRRQDQVNAAAGHRLAQPGKLAGLVLQVHGEHGSSGAPFVRGTASCASCDPPRVRAPATPAGSAVAGAADALLPSWPVTC